ncbi:MAG: HAMP domain-containing sensor histidine kinase [Flavobacteriales bacterium]
MDNATREKYLNTTLQGTEKLKNLVDELFELSKLESKQTKAQIEPFSIQELTFDIANQFKIASAEKGIVLTVDSPSDIPVVKGDIALIDRVIQNLITNSIKHCENGDSIKIDIRQDEGVVWVSVSDTGSGIAPEDLPHLFDRFYKGRSGQKGTGLGLAIVKHILELHHSTFKVDSKQNEGTKFVFSLNI